MDISINKSNINESTLVWAIICSILLHAILVIVVPDFKFDLTEEKPIQLEIEIQKPVEPKAAEVVQPAEPVVQPKPEVKKPEPIKKVIEPKPVTKTVKEPSPITEVEEIAPPPQPAPSPEVIAVAPKADVAPVAIVAPPSPPAPEVAKVPERSQTEVDNALGEYGNLLGRAIAKHKQYPRIAQMRGWQGEVLLDLKLDGHGKVLSASVRESSGYDALDKQALEMVRKASPFPAPPEALRNRTFNITVPVSFKLE